jgi:predicted ester cyclase
MSHALWLQRFVNLYSSLGTDNFTQLKEVYHPDVMFRDPMHQVMGLNALIDYFEHVYQKVDSCTFTIEHVVATDDEAAVYWRMTYRHKQLNRHQPITVEGHSQLRLLDGLVGYHRDYLDVGAMVYEHIPLLGRVIRLIKQRAGQQ